MTQKRVYFSNHRILDFNLRLKIGRGKKFKIERAEKMRAEKYLVDLGKKD